MLFDHASKRRQSEKKILQQMTRRDPDMLFLGAAFTAASWSSACFAAISIRAELLFILSWVGKENFVVFGDGKVQDCLIWCENCSVLSTDGTNLWGEVI